MPYDYWVHDELERLRRSEQQAEERPRLELPLPIPFWPETPTETPEEEDTSVIILQM